jgi:hypothetical protein
MYDERFPRISNGFSDIPSIFAVYKMAFDRFCHKSSWLSTNELELLLVFVDLTTTLHGGFIDVSSFPTHNKTTKRQSEEIS